MQKGVRLMGKDLKGKELGVGLSQRKDGLYQACHKGKIINGHWKNCPTKQK